MDIKQIIKQPTNSLFERKIFTFLLSAIADSIASNNNISFMKIEDPSDSLLSYHIIFNFINNGGLSGLRSFNYHNVINDSIISDATIYHLATASAILDNFKFKEYFQKASSKINQFNNILLDNTIKFNLAQSIIIYNELEKSSGVAMRCMCIGLFFNYESDLKKMLEITYLNSKETHNNGIAFLGGFVSAFFTSLAINNVSCFKWIDLLLNLLQQPLIDDFIVTYIKEKKYLDDKIKFTNKILLYKERIEIKKKNDSIIYPNIRTLFYNRNFEDNSLSKQINIGKDGDDSIIISYDCLLDCHIGNKPSFEKLIYLSALHLGKNNVTASIACAWYGALYGKTSDIPNNLFFDLNCVDEIIKIGNKLQSKYDV